MAKKYRLYEDCTNEKSLREIAEILRGDAIIIYPTDSTYALGCSLESIKAINRIKKIKNKKDDNLSLICCDLSNISDYARVDNVTFKFLKEHTPSPVTFILNASNKVPNSFMDNKKSVGIRIPQCNIALKIVKELGVPLVSTTVPLGNLSPEDSGEPSLLWEEFEQMVDVFIDAGELWGNLTTVVDMTSDEPVVIREGDYKFE